MLVYQIYRFFSNARKDFSAVFVQKNKQKKTLLFSAFSMYFYPIK